MQCVYFSDILIGAYQSDTVVLLRYVVSCSCAEKLKISHSVVVHYGFAGVTLAEL